MATETIGSTDRVSKGKLPKGLAGKKPKKFKHSPKSKELSNVKIPNKYVLYETSVQDAEDQVHQFKRIYKETNGKQPKSLREDFSGTCLISCEWVKQSDEHTAVALDLDPEPLNYGKKNHLSKLSSKQRKRLIQLEQNVLSVTKPKVDVEAACNFSFFIFKEYKTLVKYFENARKSLNKDGVFILEMVGGPGFMEVTKETTKHKKDGKHWFTYIWDQQWFDPISHDTTCAIHFKFPDGGPYLKNAFVYEWRAWTIPEIRMALKDAGFGDSFVYWELDEDEIGDDGEAYHRREKGDDSDTWIVYVVGHNTKKKKKKK